MMWILLTGLVLGLAQGTNRRWWQKYSRASSWMQMHFGRLLVLGWVFWGILLFFWFSSPLLTAHTWTYPLLVTALVGLLWFLLKEYWLGWAFAWRWGNTSALQVYWEGQTLKVGRLRNFSIILVNAEKQYEIPFSQAQALVAQIGSQKSNKRQYHRSRFLLAPHLASQAHIAKDIQRFLLQTPWSLPSNPPKIALQEVSTGTEVLLEIAASNPHYAQKMASMAEKFYGTH